MHTHTMWTHTALTCRPGGLPGHGGQAVPGDAASLCRLAFFLYCFVMHIHSSCAGLTQLSNAGLVDFLGMVVKLPQGTQQVFLGLAFFLEGFLMLMHKKHEAFDAGVHWLLGTTMWAAAAFVWLQLRYPRSLWLGLGRAASCLMQGIWLWQVCCCCCCFWSVLAPDCRLRARRLDTDTGRQLCKP